MILTVTHCDFSMEL